MAPVDPFQKIDELGGGDRHGASCRCRPKEAGVFQSFDVQQQPEAVAPEAFDQTAAPSAEHVQIAGLRIAPEPLLHQERQALHAAAHIGDACGDPDPGSRRDRDHHRSSTSRTRVSAAASTPASTTMHRLWSSTTTIRLASGDAEVRLACSGWSALSAKRDANDRGHFEGVPTSVRLEAVMDLGGSDAQMGGDEPCPQAVSVRRFR